MPYELRLGWRYLYGGKRDRSALIGAGLSLLLIGVGIGITAEGTAKGLGVMAIVLGMLMFAVFGLLSTFSVFTSVSVLGVVFGVAALTVVLAVTTGFQEQFREKVLGVNAHVIIMKTEPAFPEYRNVMDKARAIDPDVIAVQPFIFAEMLVTRGKGQLSGVAIKGVDPELVKQVLDLEKHMTEGSIDSLSAPLAPGELPPIIMGKELARKLRASVGDDVTVVVPLSNVDPNTWRAKSAAPRTRKFRVTGIFYSGFDEYDRRLMYTTLKETQVLWGKGDIAMGVELKVRDVDRAAEIARKLGGKLGEPPYQVQDWYELNHNLFTALTLQKLALTIILTLIIAVAAFNMVAALVLMVTDKTREIAILKSMGATSMSIATVFQVVGIAIGGVGTAVGVGIGVATCYVVRGYGYHLDPKVYLIDRLPIEVRSWEVLLVAGVTMVISVLATLYPSAKASGCGRSRACGTTDAAPRRAAQLAAPSVSPPSGGGLARHSVSSVVGVQPHAPSACGSQVAVA
jgi:lipoprotein-releasing system permease protein